MKVQDVMISGGFLVTVFFFLLFLYIIFGLTLYYGQSKVVFFPVERMESAPDRIGLEYQKVRFKTADDVRLFSWFLPAQQNKGVILFFHGNAGNISHRLDTLAIFNQLGYSTLIFDYRGYGKSEGTPSEQGLYLDAEAAWKYLVEEMEVKPEDIIIFGRSLGGPLAAHIAAQNSVRACIVESTFTSAKDIASSLYPLYPVGLICRFKFETLQSILKKSAPLLVVHSSDDEIIPFSHGRKIYEAAADPKTFLAIGGDHNNGFMLSGRQYIDGLENFLSDLL